MHPAAARKHVGRGSLSSRGFKKMRFSFFWSGLIMRVTHARLMRQDAEDTPAELSEAQN